MPRTKDEAPVAPRFRLTLELDAYDYAPEHWDHLARKVFALSSQAEKWRLDSAAPRCSFCGGPLANAKRAPKHGAKTRCCGKKECRRARTRLSMRKSRRKP